MHEIAHVERRDNLVVLLQAIAKAAFWPIPFMHLLNRELESAREEICDNHVLACRDAVSYGETLLRVAHLVCETTMPVGTVGILHWRGKLEDRIFGLIHKGRNKMTRMHPLMALGVLALFLSASAILCGTTIVAAQPPQTATPGDDRVTESSNDDSRKAQDKRDQPPAAEAPVKAPQKQEKEAFTAWGKEVGGLQAGLGFRPGERRVYRIGETITFVVLVRNVGKKDVKIESLDQFFFEDAPTITDGDGKPISLEQPIEFSGIPAALMQENLAPGKGAVLCELDLVLRPASEKGQGRQWRWTLYETGKFQVQFEKVGGNIGKVGAGIGTGEIRFDPILSKLATGKLELEVKEPEKIPTGEGSLHRLGQGGRWPASGLGLPPRREAGLPPRRDGHARPPGSQRRHEATASRRWSSSTSGRFSSRIHPR